MAKIKNKEQLVSQGCTYSRKIVLEIVGRTLEELDSYRRIKSILSYDGRFLQIGKRKWDLEVKGDVYLIGAGKACNHMLKAVDEVLGDRLTKGIGIAKIIEATDVYNNTILYQGGHPIPNESGVQACEKILDLVNNAKPEDLFITVMSGGSSALMCCPIEEISLEDKKRTTDILLKSGANHRQINAVRRHLSKMNGGNLGKKIAERGCEIIGFSIYDGFGPGHIEDITEPVKNYHGTPAGPDETTLDEARQVIVDYGLKETIPKSVIKFFDNCGPERETPKSIANATYYIINTVPDSCLYAKRISDSMGIPAHILSTSIIGESSEIGIFIATIAREIQQNSRPFKAPCVLLLSGETTTRILDSASIGGHGGPSQEFVIGFALQCSDIDGVCAFSMDSEGTDGTTDAAGGIVDSSTFLRAQNRGINLREALNIHASYEALSRLNGIVVTGNTGTNVCDFNVIYVPGL